MGCRTTYDSPFHLQQESDGTIKRSLDSLPKDKVYLLGGEGFAECGNHKALRLRAQGVYSCK